MEMKFTRILTVTFTLALIILVSSSSEAAYKYGEPTNGYKVKLDGGGELKFRFRLQPRFDFGNVSNDGKDYNTDTDFYMRRIRLETSGNMMKNLSFKLVFEGDNWDKNQQSSSLDVQYAYVDYKLAKFVSLKMGRHKLPLSRVSITSSSKQLLIERPVSTEAEKKFFDDNHQFIVALHETINKSISYTIAVADGWDPSDSDNPDEAIFDAGDIGAGAGEDSFVTDSENLLLAKVTFSPPGWSEGKQSGSHLGKGQHLTIGAHGALQKSVKHDNTANGGSFGAEDDRKTWGLEASFHVDNLTLQFEYVNIKNTSTHNLIQFRAAGWYIQGGYYIPQLNMELVGRYEIFDENVNKPSYETETTSTGINWYGKGHSYKVSFNWVRSEFDSKVREVPLESEKDLFQTQVQYYF